MQSRDLGPLAGILGLRIRLAHGAVQRHFAEQFSELDLTQKQVSVLWLVEEAPGIAQTDIARRLDMDRATTMAIVHALERKSLLQRSRARDDGRRIALELTRLGASQLKAAKTAIAKHERWLKDRFSKPELDLLFDLLSRIRM